MPVLLVQRLIHNLCIYSKRLNHIIGKAAWRTCGWLLTAQFLICLASYVAANQTRFPAANLDALLVLIPWMGPLLAIISLLLGLSTIISEVFGYQCLVFSVPELIHNAPYFPAFMQGVLTLGVLLALGLFTWTFWHARRSQRRHINKPSRSRNIGVLFIMAALAEWSSGINAFGSGFLTIRDQLVFFTRIVVNNDSEQDFKPLTTLDTSSIWQDVVAHRQDLIYIVVESYGYFHDVGIRTQLEHSLIPSEIAPRYKIQQSLHAYQGSTIHGEFRELCAVELRNMFFTRTPEKCLPEVLKNAGYVTTALHGNDGHFYRRHVWYPAIGFTNVVDTHALPAPAEHQCGGIWNAYCDLDLLAYVGTLSRDTPRFDYVLTINTHLPAKAMTRGQTNLSGCRGVYPDEVCIHLENTQRVFRAIADLARARPDAVIVIVGDHAPPFFLESSKQLFDTKAVPIHVLQPLQSNYHSNASL